MLTGRKILLAITGGIAAYKCAELTRLLVKSGAEIQVLMTSGAKAFITPLTFQALSGRPVRDSLLDPEAEMGMGHIELARWADLIIVAPASADAIARIAGGLADDLLTTVLLASEAPLAVAPAMNQAMWRNPMTQANVQKLVSLRPRTFIWGPDAGEQACGDLGPGRMLEPAAMLALTDAYFASGDQLRNCNVVITAGPTRERIDPVRYISNDSSGKMGYALAEAAAGMGAQVTLISGPVALSKPGGVKVVNVEGALDMHTEALAAVQAGANIFISAAAVADYRPVTTADQKMKKSAEQLQITLTRNPDILADVAALQDAPFTVGFAAETQKVEEYARGKLERKNINLIVANDVSRKDIGFNSDDNEVSLISRDEVIPIAKQSKQALAGQLMSHIAQQYRKTLSTDN
ncbi:bifunctional phosphopantothenoylcysteine decarboxylase/phosphopantothenate--cysteine ligase CoaBC [Hahella sp. KA22]|uniref:bifunctional phosphopantothenoylcysteine decarboxylase/phosphopantothenate--cysteine ligase CoaBC n=1 Tax=Hahella sp. KA22 TaxID=1628392 RepID=UPI000FDF5D26|nr:bifunctional phosphopantothenoylcysteine decarboxylase/phosphopantothenate--cysteine ligase CoaBC [Hahella sp. KA22]AZZ90444.1 bifunctional phosphopantothenoylcysteine decarboxylase/phosphopantothenate--cysteine ligase CoaBC [Hahella sp. KA22]QAY53813.1 bifunctional phosphopantothenoylcysteine decarboxylase/phosphopantothenate--cysteine ligase CoaBC [Hahella sp. KA22]